MKKNIAEILKYCRDGLPLWSPAYGNTELKNATDTGVIIRTKCGYILLNVDGKLHAEGECMLFPSKEQRDWEEFWPYEDGDVVALREEGIAPQLFIFKETAKRGTAYCYVFLDKDDSLDIIGGRYFVNCFATKSEEDRLFKALEKNGYRWDPVKKELESIEIVAAEEKAEKFDINTLKPFDKVLVRDDSTMNWIIDLWMGARGYDNWKYHCLGSSHIQCIPYEGNEHLLLTEDMPDEYYITWEEEK